MFHAGRIWKSWISSYPLHLFDRFLGNELAGILPETAGQIYTLLFGCMRRAITALFISGISDESQLEDELKLFGLANNSQSSLLKNMAGLPFDAIRLVAATRDKDPAVLAIMDMLARMDLVSAKMVAAGIPPYLQSIMDERILGTDAFFRQLHIPPPLWLRVNFPHKADEAIATLEAEGFQVKQEGEDVISASGEKSIYDSACFKSGRIEVQDLASQHIGRETEAAPVDLVWDMCAGTGGKSIQLASMMKNKGAIFVSEPGRGKVVLLKKRIRRSGLQNIRILEDDGESGETRPKLPVEVGKRGGFNRILVDAPCSSSGTWRRNPDAKIRFNPADMDKLNSIKLKLLSRAARVLAPGGILVFATCSIFTAENEKTAQAFLGTHPDFRLERESLWGYPWQDSDTVYTAVLRKIKK